MANERLLKILTAESLFRHILLKTYWHRPRISEPIALHLLNGVRKNEKNSLLHLHCRSVHNNTFWTKALPVCLANLLDCALDSQLTVLFVVHSHLSFYTLGYGFFIYFYCLKPRRFTRVIKPVLYEVCSWPLPLNFLKTQLVETQGEQASTKTITTNWLHQRADSTGALSKCQFTSRPWHGLGGILRAKTRRKKLPNQRCEQSKGGSQFSPWVLWQYKKPRLLNKHITGYCLGTIQQKLPGYSVE